MNWFRKQFNNKGFTLVELMVVMAIIGILAAIAVPRLTTSTDSAKRAKIQADLRTIDTAISGYYVDKGSYPAIADLVSGKYLASTPKPPSGDLGTKGAISADYGINTDNRATVTIGKTDYTAENVPAPN